ncbi:MAG: hypothetical protein ACYC5M_14695 [Anaerolineae bacterium]
MSSPRGVLFSLVVCLVLLAGCASGPITIPVPQTVEIPITVIAWQTVEVPVTIIAVQTVEIPITVEVVHTRLVTVEVPVTVEVAVAQVATPRPATAAAPVAVPGPSAMQVIEAFRQAGLEAEGTYAMGVQDYGGAPLRAVEAFRFLIPSLGEESGGRVFRCATQSDLEAVRAYYVELGKASAWFFSWTFAKGSILVQINGDLPEEQALRYEAALMAMD